MNLSMIAYFCLILNAVSGDASGILYVETNGGFLLLPHISGVKEDIFWKHNHNKMVEWNRMRPGISEYLQFQQRTQLNTETGDVTVTGVTTADRGLYEAEITVNRKIKRFTQQICNIFKLPPDPVRNTRISCDVTGSTVTLVCEADGPLLSYSWTGPGLQNPENRSQIQINRSLKTRTNNQTPVMKMKVKIHNSCSRNKMNKNSKYFNLCSTHELKCDKDKQAGQCRRRETSSRNDSQ
uniref:Ig-like domain-containing protein n=1 Tax=Denticeps clupeoides TaxID=299321 RepID=A0AAY4EVH8_9TELE